MYGIYNLNALQTISCDNFHVGVVQPSERLGLGDPVTHSLPQLRSKLAALEQEVATAGEGREETEERAGLVTKLEQELAIKARREERLKDFAENDPVVLEQMVRETKEAVEATNRSAS